MSELTGYELLLQSVNADGMKPPRSEASVRNYFTALAEEEIRALNLRFGIGLYEGEAVKKKHERAKMMQVKPAQLERIEQSAIKKLRTVQG